MGAKHSHPNLPFIVYAFIMKKSSIVAVFIAASALFQGISIFLDGVPGIILSVCALVCSICSLILALRKGD